MPAAQPHYLLTAETADPRQWHVVLETPDGHQRFEAADEEPAACGERLELLAVVRGLEALDQPSHVTLFTDSRYVNRGLTYGLEQWRANGWHWQWYGAMAPVRNGDLWRRLDRALSVHQVDLKAAARKPGPPTPEAGPRPADRNIYVHPASSRKVCASGAEFAA